tara:strand:+ start:53 stop:736 length:684 start_codon:yes stop_codon:yes gene_type:complete
MDTVNTLLNINEVFIYSYPEMLFNLGISFMVGMVISWIYKITHRGLSYSQSFVLTIVFVTLITSMVIMVIGNNLARAFALVGALSIIRFRTVVKDTKDTAFVFLGLAAGLAAGTSNYFLAISGTAIISAVAIILYYTDYGSLYKSEFIIRYISATGKDDQHSKVLQKFTKSSSLLHVEPTGDGKAVRISLDVEMKPGVSHQDLVSNLNKTEGVSDVLLIASKNDVDY